MSGRHRGAFWFLWGAETVSMFGTQVNLIAVPLTAVELLGASELEMGVLTAAGWLPVVFLGLLVGVWVDRGRPLPIMITANLVRMLLIALIPMAHLLGMLNIWWLLGVALSAGVFAVFFDVAYQTYVADVVSPDKLATANSRLELSRSVAQLTGPALGGALVSVLSAPDALSLDAVSYGVATLLLLPLLQRRRATLDQCGTGSGPDDPPPALLSLVREGLRFIRRHALIRAVVVAASASNFFISGVMALQVLLAVKTLGMSATQLGLVLAVEGAGALLAAAVTPRLNAWCGEGALVLASLVLMAAGGVLMGTAAAFGHGGIWLFLAAQLMFGVSGPLINISLVTLRQRLTPKELLGRVNASARVAIMASLPLGSLVLGFVATAIGISSTFIVIAVGLALVALGALRPMRRIPRCVAP
ncbi:MFS transporter [Austwickia sp. TVS 96-490-7B]|uniref:MFS transporter n=1 Tax=Austwickia sp. TVS 96-490-7B TaxID=2830843 RepID=UPI001C5A543E|nr:MFS transporter [Austwickia sp. TVS 96-490-7B]